MSVILIITSFFPLMTFLEEVIVLYLQQQNFFGKFNVYFQQGHEKQSFGVKDAVNY